MKSIRKLIQRPLLATAALALLGSLATPAFAGKTIDAIKARGTLNCGVTPACLASQLQTAKVLGWFGCGCLPRSGCNAVERFPESEIHTPERCSAFCCVASR